MSVKSADGTKTSLIGDSLHLGHTLIWGRAIRPLLTPSIGCSRRCSRVLHCRRFSISNAYMVDSRDLCGRTSNGRGLILVHA